MSSEPAEIENIVEAALFISGKPLTVDELSRIAGCKRDDVVTAIKLIRRRYAAGAIDVREVNENVYEMHVKPRYMKYVESLVPEKEFSPGTLKTLAYIAYKSPVKQSEVAGVRGNRAYEQIAELVRRGFVSSKPKGHTRELRITKSLLKYFGLKSEAELKRYFMKINLDEKTLSRNDEEQ